MAVPRQSRIALATGALVLLATLALASFVQQATPDAATQFAPIIVRAPLGEWASGRQFEARASEPRFAAEILSESDGRPFPSTGRWLVVDISSACVLESCQLQSATLSVGEEEFRASERLGTESLMRTMIAAEIVSSGIIAFELPLDIVDRPGASTAELLLSAAFDERLDSQLTFSVDLSSLSQQNSVTAFRPVTEGAR